MRAGSSLLDPANKEHWDQIQKSEGGTAHLLRNFESYANTLAQNVRKTYLKPFTIVTDNMSEWRRRERAVESGERSLCASSSSLLLTVLTVDYLDVIDPERATLPRFEDIGEVYPKELGSYVQFPQFNLRPQGHRGSSITTFLLWKVVQKTPQSYLSPSPPSRAPARPPNPD